MNCSSSRMCFLLIGSLVLPHMANIAYRRGRTLTFDGEKERFVGDRQAQTLLARNYRKPFVVPDKV